METILILDPEKLKQARGHRTLREVVEAAGNVFTEQQLSAWEKGKYRPRPENLPALLKGLGVTFSEIAQPLSLAA